METRKNNWKVDERKRKFKSFIIFGKAWYVKRQKIGEEGDLEKKKKQKYSVWATIETWKKSCFIQRSVCSDALLPLKLRIHMTSSVTISVKYEVERKKKEKKRKKEKKGSRP